MYTQVVRSLYSVAVFSLLMYPAPPALCEDLHIAGQLSTSQLTPTPQSALVTDFSDSVTEPLKPGTLRHAVKTVPPGGVISFARPGTVHLAAPLELTVPEITIDGRSNPAIIVGDTVRIRASGITLRHLWIFAGDAPPSGKHPGVDGHSKPGERDAVTIWGGELGSDQVVRNTTIDHCWIGFGIDECFSTYGNVEGVEVSHSIIGFGLNRSLHPKDLTRPEAPGHGKGVLVGVGAKNVTFISNLLVHNFDRNIAVREDTQEVVFINNVVYNFGRGNTFVVAGAEKGSSGVFVGNIYVAGEASWKGTSPFRPANEKTAQEYQAFANIGTIEQGIALDTALSAPLSISDKSGLAKYKASTPNQAFSEVLRHSGPHPGLSDSLSTRVVNEVTSRTGSVIDYVSTQRNPQAKIGLGTELSLESLTTKQRLEEYSFNPAAGRAAR